VEGWVLAGGASSRMGRDKALLELGGQSLIALALEKLRALGTDLKKGPRIAGSRTDLAAYAPAVADNFPGCGPLGGIEAALAASESELNLFLPVDLPLLPVEFLRWMAARAEESAAAATFPLLAGRPQPLCAVYSRRLLPGLSAALAAGDFKVIPALESAAVGSLDAFEVEPLAAALVPATWPSEPPVQAWFRNLNAPEDYELVRSRNSLRASVAKPRNPIS
jgi:molybdenum cofactor guanylyltransferase